MSRFRRTKIVLYSCCIFAAGAVAGIFQGMSLMAPSEARLAENCMAELQTELRLTPEQERLVRPLLADAFVQFREAKLKDALMALRDCNGRIAEVLTLEQRPRLEKLAREQEDFVERCFGGNKTPPPKTPADP